jgi:hypothetical protein
MAAGYYSTDVLDFEEGLDMEEEDESYEEEVDEMLDALLDESGEDLSEKRARRSKGRKNSRRKGVKTASGRSAYQTPTAENGPVTQKQFKEAMSRVGEETRRNAEGIKTVNARFGALDGRVDGVVTVSKAQSDKIRSLDSRMKIDGALDFASSFNVVQTGSTVSLQPDLSQMLRGAVKNGVLGNGKGALANPWIVGGIALVLTKTDLVGGLLGPRTATGVVTT